jgi:hypothetical protein
MQSLLQLNEQDACLMLVDDRENFIGAEGEEMEKKAKTLKRRNERDAAKRNTVSDHKTYKVGDEKVEVFGVIQRAIESLDSVEVAEVKTQTKIKFKFKGKLFTASLTQNKKW